MMLIQSSVPSSFDAGLSSVSDHGPQKFLCFWIPGAGTWQERHECDRHPQHGHTKSIPPTEDKNKDDNPCSQDFLSSSQLSTKINMSEALNATFVYKRRKVQRDSAAALPPSQSSAPTLVYKRRKDKCSLTADFSAQVSTNTRASGNYFSASLSEAASVASKENMVSVVHNDSGALIVSDLHPAENNRFDLASKSGSVDGASFGCEPAIKEDQKRKLQKALDFNAMNDSCSSSKSDMDLGNASLKPRMDDVGECSSSDGLIMMEGLEKDTSGKSIFISLLNSHGGLERFFPMKSHRSAAKSNICCLRLCKVCGQSETTLQMLICDQCEEAFHISCCNPPVKKVPADEWFCHSCLRKKLKKLKENNSSKLLKDDLGPIASMLRDVEPYTTKVRIGKDFQAEVPEWTGPITNYFTDYGEPVEISTSECASYQEWNSSKLSRLSSIGNWLQCREVIDGVDGTICGKWRRAPLFEVQTDDWECFRCVLWDPTHADCAVPQELDTDQVLKHLKYIEMLRPRLTAKRCKLGANKGGDSQDHSGDPRNTEAS